MIVETSQLAKRFGSYAALRDVTLSIPEGSAFALIGANGAGKTTTIKLIINILNPSGGSATVFGVDSRKLSPHELAMIGYVSENQVMPARLTVGQYLSYLRPFYPTWDRQREAEIVEQLRLPIERMIGALSHGMRMKMSLACALPFRPKLLVLDEPFSGLDPLVRDEFMEELISQADDMTVLISSHELSEIENVVSHVAFLDQGRVLFQESMEALSARLREVRVTLTSPEPIALTTPPEWVQVKRVGNVLSFVDTRFDEESFGARIAELLGAVRNVDVQSIPLRSIFTTLARNAQTSETRK